MKSVRATLASVWQIAAPYFRSDDRRMAWTLLSAVIAIELAVVGLMVLFNRWNNVFYNALQARDFETFKDQLGYFCVLAAIFIALKVYQLYLNQWLQIRWRRFMIGRYLGEWLHGARHYQMQLLGDAADNPDQRIAEDTQLFVERTLSLGVGLLGAIVSLASFVFILWGLSNEAPLHLFGRDIDIPGYLVWGALIYAAIGTVLTHLIGRPLVDLNFNQQRFEADFRFNLVRARENAEQIALLHGERAERERLGERFARVAQNWFAIMQRTKKLTAFTASYSQASILFPYVLVAPAYFANRVQLGGMMQTASAFNSVQDSLSFFVSAYRTLAEWQAVVARLAGFEASIRSVADYSGSAETVALGTSPGGAIAFDDLQLRLPNGAPLLSADGVTIGANARTLIMGPSGSGKSTLFRAIAGIWPFGRGRIGVPDRPALMTLPQRPYFPVGALEAAVTYPAESSAFTTAQCAEALEAVGLGALAARLGEHGHWNRTLSLGEQQRLGLARALLHRPGMLLLDEATASLDEKSEAKLYALLAARLPDSAIVSIGHRNTLKAFHDRRLDVARTGDDAGFVLREAAAAAAKA